MATVSAAGLGSGGVASEPHHAAVAVAAGDSRVDGAASRRRVTGWRQSCPRGAAERRRPRQRDE